MGYFRHTFWLVFPQACPLVFLYGFVTVVVASADETRNLLMGVLQQKVLQHQLSFHQRQQPSHQLSLRPLRN